MIQIMLKGDVKHQIIVTGILSATFMHIVNYSNSRITTVRGYGVWIFRIYVAWLIFRVEPGMENDKSEYVSH